MNFRSIALRLVLFYTGTLLVAGIAFALFTLASFRLYTTRTMEHVISTRANDVWNVSQGALENQADLAQLIERRFSPAAEDRFIRISREGKILYRSSDPAGRSFDPRAIYLPDESRLPQTYQLENLTVYANHFRDGSGKFVVVESGQADNFFDGLYDSLVTSLVLGIPFLVIIAAEGAYVLIRRALSPVETMITAAEDISFNNPRNRLPLLGTADRIEALGLALNRMLDRLDNAYHHASRFSADAAHEIRTPLAIIRAGLELEITNHGLPQHSREQLGDLLEEVTRLSHMTDNLLLLTHMDSVWGQQNQAPVELLELARETAEQMARIAEAHGITLNKVTGSPVTVYGDRDRIKQALVNLLDNAVNYNRADGQIWMEVTSDGAMGVITIRDSGIGIEASAQEYIFDRFYRVATMRGVTGTGLGLAIVRSICAAHGGQVAVESHLGEGSLFTIRLPRGPKSA